MSDLLEVLGLRKRVERVVTKPEDQSTTKKTAKKHLPLSVKRLKLKGGAVVLEVKELETLSEKGLPALNKVSFSIRGGEILGFAGTLGSGQRELASVVTGLKKATGGEVHILGKNLTNSPPKKIVDQGVGHIPEDRAGFGAIMNLSIKENLILGAQSEPRFKKRWFLNHQEIDRHAEKLIKEYEIKASGKDALVRSLSSENVQRVVVARELSRNPKLLIANQPTRGLDLITTRFIQNKLMEQRNNGVAILLASEDLDEIITLSDRVAVMYQGSIVDVLPASKAKVSDIGLMMAGVKQPARKLSHKV